MHFAEDEAFSVTFYDWMIARLVKYKIVAFGLYYILFFCIPQKDDLFFGQPMTVGSE